jgi:predicted RNase H-like HicB family nuclease
MIKFTYLAVFEPSEKGYSVYFPDLPGCVSYGESLEDAQKQSAEALGLHIYGMEKDGDEIPAPSKTPQLDPETVAGYIVEPVTAIVEWDSDFTKLTPFERERLLEADREVLAGEVVDHNEIDWSRIFSGTFYGIILALIFPKNINNV